MKINIYKFTLINEIIKRMIGSNQYPYDYKRNEIVLGFLKELPNKNIFENAIIS